MTIIPPSSSSSLRLIPSSMTSRSIHTIIHQSLRIRPRSLQFSIKPTTINASSRNKIIPSSLKVPLINLRNRPFHHACQCHQQKKQDQDLPPPKQENPPQSSTKPPSKSHIPNLMNTPKQFSAKSKELSEKSKQIIKKFVPRKEDIYTIPNLLTMSRLAISPLIGYLIVQHQFFPALMLFGYAGVSDMVCLLIYFFERIVPNQRLIFFTAGRIHRTQLQPNDISRHHYRPISR